MKLRKEHWFTQKTVQNLQQYSKYCHILVLLSMVLFEIAQMIFLHHHDNQLLLHFLIKRFSAETSWKNCREQHCSVSQKAWLIMFGRSVSSLC